MKPDVNRRNVNKNKTDGKIRVVGRGLFESYYKVISYRNYVLGIYQQFWILSRREIFENCSKSHGKTRVQNWLQSVERKTSIDSRIILIMVSKLIIGILCSKEDKLIVNYRSKFRSAYNDAEMIDVNDTLWWVIWKLDIINNDVTDFRSSYTLRNARVSL